MEVLNMLNVKYILLKNEQGQLHPVQNEEALGNAWFITDLRLLKNDDEIMQGLTDFQARTEALTTLKDLQGTSIPSHYAADSTATIALQSYRPDELVYESHRQKDGFAVFSEMYYPHGWKATIDGKEVPIYRVDYTLRGLSVPAGKHEIRFRFVPEVVKTGSTLSLLGNGLLLLWGGIGLFRFKKRKDTSKEVG